jgi:uncharacterized protein (DUF433 family)
MKRITIDQDQMDGQPCVRGLRIPVATVLRLLSGGVPDAEILRDYPDLEPEDLDACRNFPLDNKQHAV